jgi:DNA polymerase-3 subunit alpha
MEKYLKDTSGITVYQEQVMLLSRQLADFTRGQSDTLRKAMGKKQIEKMNELEELFYKGGIKNGYDQKVLNKIWEDWKKFASYAFNKSHATCYSWVAYQTAYLKAHYPAEYMAAVMSRNLDNITEITKLMDECKAMGIETLGPDVNESRHKFSVNKNGAIRFGLAAIKGMGSSAAEAIISERDANGPFADIFDVVKRVNLSAANRKAFESMTLSGGFDSFGIARERYLAPDNKGNIFLDTLVRFGQLYQTEKMQAQMSLFGSEEVEISTPPIPESEPWSNIERLNRERDLVGIYLSAHPLDEYSMILNHLCNTHCPELADKEALTKRETVTFGGVVTSVKSKFSRNGSPCGFVTIEDFTGSGELALFGEEWAKWRGMLTEACTVYVTAKSVPRFRGANVYDLRIGDIQFMQTYKEKAIERLTIIIHTESVDSEKVSNLVAAIEANQGNTALYIQLQSPQGKLQLRSRSKKVDVSHQLIQLVEQTDGMTYFIN